MTSAPPTPTDSFSAGVSLLRRGFARWRIRPRQMALGLIPPAIVGAAFLAGFAALIGTLPLIVGALSGFADDWPSLWAILVRVAIGAALLAGAVGVAVLSFTALSLVVGEPFYDRIWRGVETDATGSAPDASYGFWRSVGDACALIGRGLGIGILTALIGLVPVVGAPAGWAVGVWLTGRVLADELTSRALTARGLGRAEQRRLVRMLPATARGFGVATQLCFLVPLGAVAVMPAAVAGSTLLAHALLAADPAARMPPPALRH